MIYIRTQTNTGVNQMTRQAAKFVVVKTITRELAPEMTASGKKEFINNNLFYYQGTWLADWCNARAQLFSLAAAKKVVIGLDNDDPNITFNWINVKAVNLKAIGN